MNIRPLTFEFTGPPCSGKTTLITGLADKLSDMGFKVKVIHDVAEQLSIFISERPWETHTWITCGRMKSLLEIPYLNRDIVLLDRGFSDALFWSKFLYVQNLCTKKQCDTLYRYLQEMNYQFNLSPDCLFLIDVSAEDSLARNPNLLGYNILKNEKVISLYRKNLIKFYKRFKSNRCYIDTTNISISEVENVALSYICHMDHISKYADSI